MPTAEMIAVLAAGLGLVGLALSSYSLYARRRSERLSERHAWPVPPMASVLRADEGVTVRALIEQLQKEPPDAPVFVISRLATIDVPAVEPVDLVLPAVVRAVPSESMFGYTYLGDRARARYEGQQNAVILLYARKRPDPLQPFGKQE
ncbi:hypothetical protein [Dolichospermum phage Dfl-JY45]